MAFMALFGWIFLPLIPIALMLVALESVVVWVMTHIALVNVIAAVLLVLNLLILMVLLRVWARRKQKGVKKYRVLLLLAALWEGWVVLLCGLYLALQPLRFLPAGFGEPFSLENNCYGVWTITACQGTTPGSTQTQEEIDRFLGGALAYQENRFYSTEWAYSLSGEDAYQTSMVREESFPLLYSMSLENLGVDAKSLRHVEVTLPKEMEGDNPLGLDFYVLDKNTLLVYRKGVFFRAERADGPVPEQPERPMIRDPQAASYFGAWKVTQCLGTAPEDPMEPEFVKKILGTELMFQAGYVRFDRDGVGGSGARDPAYEELELTPEEFQSAFGISLEDLGVEPDVYHLVTMEADSRLDLEGLQAFEESLGNQFLVLNGETLLLCGRGAFFRAELVPGSWPMIPDPDV